MFESFSADNLADHVAYSADDASYQYCISGRQVVRFEVMTFEKQGVSGPRGIAPEIPNHKHY